MESANNALDAISWKTFESQECLICGSERIRPHFSSSKLNIPMSFSRCDNCTAIFQNPRPHRDSMARIFNDENLFGGRPNNKSFDDSICYYDYSAYEDALSRNAVPLLKKLSRFAPPPGRLLEVGGATGWFMKAARDFGYQVQGLDISSTLAAEVRKRYDIDVTVAAIEEAPLPDGSFNAICSFGGIECWMDPHRAFRNISRMLARDGVFFFNYIDTDTVIARMMGDKYYQYGPGTGLFFNRRTMHYLLARHGFRILSEKMPMTHISLGPLCHYFGLKKLFRLSTFLRIDKAVFVLPNIQARTVAAVKPS